MAGVCSSMTGQLISEDSPRRTFSEPQEVRIFKNVKDKNDHGRVGDLILQPRTLLGREDSGMHELDIQLVRAPIKILA